MPEPRAHAATGSPIVFLSHTTGDPRDLALAGDLAAGLRARGASVWMAEDSLKPGVAWEPELVAGVLERCTHFLVILSAASSRSPWVLAEIRLARERHARDPTFPVLCIEAGRIDSSAETEFLARFQHVQYEPDPSAQLDRVASVLGLGPGRASPLEEYLTVVRAYCESFPYLTLRELQSTKTLGDVYVPLWAETQPDPAPGLEKRADDDAGRAAPGTALSLHAVMGRLEPRHVLLLGEPGTGKSTALRRLAAHCWDDFQSVGLAERCLPLIVPLRRLAAAEGAVEDRFRSAVTGEMALRDRLPPDFLEQWTRETGAPWLLLLDGLDETPAAERAQLLQWLTSALPLFAHHRLVIASRTSGYEERELDARQFAQYRLLPFTPEQAEALARNWFGTDAPRFLDELRRLRADHLAGTPLLLAIAAKVFQRTGRLPDRRERLYRTCVEICLEEAAKIGLDRELGEELAGPLALQLARLGHLALRMTEQPHAETPDELAGFVAEHLFDEEGLPRTRARAYGGHFVEIMSRRSTVLVRRGENVDTLHQTFKEFLAATAIVGRHAPDSDEAWRFVERWDSYWWVEPILFAFGLWSDKKLDVSAPLARIIETPRGVAFAAAAIADGLRVDPSLERSIVDRLLHEARDAPRVNWRTHPERFNPLVLLSRLADRPAVVDGLTVLAHDATLRDGDRVKVLGALARVGRSSEAAAVLADIVRSQDAGFWDSNRAGYLLRNVADAGLLVPLALDPGIDVAIRLEAAAKRVEWAWDCGAPDEVVPVLLQLASQSGPNPMFRLRAVQLVTKLAPPEQVSAALRSIVAEPQARATTRMLAARELTDLGRREEGESILLAIACDEHVPPGLRRQAGFDVSMAGRSEPGPADLLRWMDYACDPRLPRDVRFVAGDRALQASIEDVADVGGLLALARDDTQDPRLRAVVLQRLACLRTDPAAGEIHATLHHLARLGGSETLQLIAAEALETLGHGDEAVTVMSEAFRAHGLAPLAALLERLARVLPPAEAFAVTFEAGSLVPQWPGTSEAGAGEDPDALRRRRSLAALVLIVAGDYPGDPAEWLNISCHPLVERPVRTAARAYACLAVAVDKSPAELAAMLAERAADPCVREVAAWRLGTLPGGAEQAAALVEASRDAATPGPVRLAALEALVALQKEDEATDALIVAAGGTPTPRKRHVYHEEFSEPHYRLLAEAALSVGCERLAPILVDAVEAVGPDLVGRLMSWALEGTAPRSPG